jgi:N-acetylglutamate synthase-like GNAT family acetyltransferase
MRSPAPLAQFRPAAPSDRSAVEALLVREHLPLDGVAEHFGTFVIAESGEDVVGAAGLEIHGALGLVRSVVVVPEAKGQGIGRGLTHQLLTQARARKLDAVYLLTTTAPDFFARLGFERIAREAAPAPLWASAEFQGACPASAIVMRLSLES